jgi:MFS family permease
MGRIERADPDLPRSVWVLEAGGFVDSFGTGLVFPFVVGYLHDVRHIFAAMAGFFIAARGAAGLALAPVGGVATDRFGPRLVAIAAMVVAAVGWLGLAGVHHPWQAAGDRRPRRARRESDSTTTVPIAASASVMSHALTTPSAASGLPHKGSAASSDTRPTPAGRIGGQRA